MARRQSTIGLDRVKVCQICLESELVLPFKTLTLFGLDGLTLVFQIVGAVPWGVAVAHQSKCRFRGESERSFSARTGSAANNGVGVDN